MLDSGTTYDKIEDTASTDTLKEVKITGSDVVKVGDIDSTALEKVSVEAEKALQVGNVTASNNLSSVTYKSSTDTVTAGNIGGSSVTKLSTVDISGKNAVTVGTIDAKDLDNITISSSNADLNLGNITAHSDSDGFNVTLSAKTHIDDGTGSAFTIENDKGNINTVTLRGDADAKVNLTINTTTNDAYVKTVDASNLKGGLTMTITNDDSSSSVTSKTTVYLGAKDSNTQNTVTFAGSGDEVIVNGSAGKDKVVMGDATAKTATIYLGSGTDTLDLSGLNGYSTTGHGVVVNLSSTSHTIGSGSNATNVASSKVAEYDPTNDKVVSDGYNFTVSGVEVVVGTSQKDIIYASNTGSLIDSGRGADEIYGGAGNDKVYAGLGNDSVNAGAGDDGIVIIGTLNGTEYTADVQGTIAEDLGLTSILTSAKATSDITNSTPAESIDGGAGNDTLEAWGNIDLTLANISNIETIDTHSSIKINASQLLSLANSTTSGTVDVNLLDNNSTITLKDIDQLSVTDAQRLINTLSKTNFDFHGNTTAKIQTEQFDLDSNGTPETTFVMNMNLLGDTGNNNLTGNDTATDFIWGSGGNDTLSGGGLADLLIGGNGQDTFVGGAGNDVLILLEGTSAQDTVQIAFGGEDQDYIIGFEVGAGKDVFDFTGTSDVTGTGITANAGEKIDINSLSANVTITKGLTVIYDSDTTTELKASALDANSVATFLGNVDGSGHAVQLNNADNVVYIVVTDGTDAALYKVDDQNGDTTIDAADLTPIAIFMGWGNNVLSQINNDNFADFTIA